jgi:hypothetical protein
MRRRISYEKRFVWTIYFFGVLALLAWPPRAIQNPGKELSDFFQRSWPFLVVPLIRLVLSWFIKKPVEATNPLPTQTPEEEDLEFVEGIAGCFQMLGSVFVACTFYLAAGRLLMGAGWKNDAASVCMTGAVLGVAGFVVRTLARWHLLQGVEASRRREWIRKHDLELITVTSRIIQIVAAPLALIAPVIWLGGLFYGEWIGDLDMWGVGVYCAVLCLGLELWLRRAREHLSLSGERRVA